MTILHISDTHNLHLQLKELPMADVIVHSGDFTMYGTEEEALDFVGWFCDLPYKHKIFVVGNHDICLWNASGIEELPDDCHMLQNEFVDIDGVRFYGMSIYNTFVPKDVDVLISHEPPFGILDSAGNSHWGSKEIASVVQKRPPRFHLFGHAHASFGKKTKGNTTFLNSACVDNKYSLVSNHFQVFDI